MKDTCFGLQVGDIPLVLWLDIHSMSISQEVDSLEIIQESSRVYDRNTCVQASNLVQTTLCDQFGEP